MSEENEMNMISLAIFAVASLLLILGFILPVITFDDALAAGTTYSDGQVTLFDRLTDLGIGLYAIGLVFALLGAFNSYKGKSALLFGVLAGVLLLIPSIAITSIDDILEVDPDGTVTFIGRGVQYAMILCFGGGLVSKFLKK